MGFKFSIEYKSGTANRVADALSRRDFEEIIDDNVAAHSGTDPQPSLLVLYARPRPALLDELESENTTLPDLVALHRAVKEGAAPAHITVSDNFLYFKRRLYLSRDSALRIPLLEEFHGALSAGHPGERRTFERLASTFFWLGMRKDVRDYVAACAMCQATKYIAQKPAGLLQPLPIPDRVWAAASMDFIVGLPPSRGFTAVMVVVDRLTKYAHFGALRPGFDAPRVAELFVETVVKHHGFPDKLLSDRDAIFMSAFWTELLSLSGTRLQFTTAYHPQTDGQSEVTNRGLEQYLRVFSYDNPKRWATLLPWEELALNCNYHASIGTSLYRALYGRDPPNIFATPALPPRHPDVAAELEERAQALQGLKARLKHAQIVMAENANRSRRDVEFAVGDQVLLKLQPYRQHSVGKPLSQKLGRRFYGPYAITERIGKVAYRLQLPAESRVHDVFHVSLLRPFVPPISDTVMQALPAKFRESQPIDVPIRATDRRTVLFEGLPQEQWLVFWSSHPTSCPSWEPADIIRMHFPTLHLEDKVAVMDRGVDRTSTPSATTHDDMQPQPHLVDQAQAVPDDRRDAGKSNEDGTKVTRPKRKTTRPARFKDFRPR